MSVITIAVMLCKPAYSNEIMIQPTFKASGTIEIEAYFLDTESDSESDLAVSTVELALEAALTADTMVNASFLYEEDDTPFELDTATLTFSSQTPSLTFSLGQKYLPFGFFETNLVNDPLTLEIGEIRETTAIAAYEGNRLSSAIYMFNGDQDENDKNRATNFGIHLSLNGSHGLFGVNYISNLADADALQEFDFGYSVGEKSVKGASVFGKMKIKRISFLFEHLASLDPFAQDGNNSELRATHIEASVDIGQYLWALASQRSDESQFLALPEKRFSMGINISIYDEVSLGVEINRDKDYAISSGGSGESTHGLTIQLAAGF